MLQQLDFYFDRHRELLQQARERSLLRNRPLTGSSLLRRAAHLLRVWLF